MTGLRTPTGPLIVVDRCALAFQHIEETVPQDSNLVLPDTFFCEAATRKKDEPESPKFNRWARRFAERLFVSRSWEELSRMEAEPGVSVHRREIIDGELSQGLRNAVKAKGLNWERETRSDLAVSLDEVERRASEFESHCQRFSAELLQKCPEWRRQFVTAEAEDELIRWPALVTGAAQQMNPRLAGPAWAASLSVFPDQHAAGRWTRLLHWYALQHSLGKTRKFRNNYFDAEYAFAASYVGALATDDDGLIAATKAVFPYVKVFESPGKKKLPAHAPAS